MAVSESAKLKKFIDLRAEYIDMLDKGALTKDQFNLLNNKLFTNLNLRPFSNLDSFDKALFNYNYYNTKAKLALANANRYKEQKKIKKFRREDSLKLNYYEEKDKATLAMINLEDSSYIEAYFINLHSRNLSSSIFEIFFKARDKVVLHSKSEYIKKRLIELGVFSPIVNKSIIDSYVNQG